MIESDFLAQIFPLLILIAFAFLILVAWLFWIVSRRERAKRRGSRSAGGGLFGGPADSPPPADVNESMPDVTSHAGGDDTVEVFRVLRDLADGALIVEIEGQRYRRLKEITDAQVGRRFVSNARAVGHFAKILKGPAPPPPPLEAPAATPPADANSPEPPLPPPPIRTASPARPPEAVPMRPLQALRRQAKESEEEEPPAEMINVAEQIEALLQHRLAMTPEFAERSIHVQPNFTGGVRIVVDGTSYDTVDEVPEEPVRDFIQATIREWNAGN